MAKICPRFIQKISQLPLYNILCLHQRHANHFLLCVNITRLTANLIGCRSPVAILFQVKRMSARVWPCAHARGASRCTGPPFNFIIKCFVVIAITQTSMLLIKYY